MPYLIDANNVIGQRVGWHRDKPAARRRLLDELATFASGKGITIIAVFDGAPETHFPDGSSYRGVQVFYARKGSSADERIKEIVESRRDRRTLVVVTSDRALAQYVRSCGCPVTRAGNFRKSLDRFIADQKAVDDSSKRDDDDLDKWMRYFGVDDSD